MRQTVRLFLLIEAVCFLIAGAIHSGMLVDIDIHSDAAIAESVIGGVLLISFLLTWIWHRLTRVIGLAAQAFALFGTLVGVATIIGGIGPRTIPDIGFHLAILIVLGWGLIVTARPSGARSIPA